MQNRSKIGFELAKAISSYKNLMLRMKREFSATVYILDEKNGKLLLVFHKKMKKWLPAGGHVDPGETPPETAIREAKEETGLDIELIKQENLWVDYPNAKSIERPFLCLLEEIPSFGNQPAHQHIDNIFIGRPIGGTLTLNPDETLGLKWFSLEDLQTLTPEEDIFQETLDTIDTIMSLFSLSPL